jgi:type IV pilus assembly protein PilV
LIEVLITIVIIAIGLLGMAGIHARSSLLEFESYQRAQALILLQDMVDRMNANAANVAGEYGGANVGTGNTSACSDTSSRALADLCEWSTLLSGAAEQSGGSKGAMIDGRGCVSRIGATPSYLVSVVWQGMSDTVPPVTDCGKDQYSSESRRRAVTAIVTVPDLLFATPPTTP